MEKKLKDEQQNYRLRMALIQNEMLKQNEMIGDHSSQDQLKNVKDIQIEINDIKAKLIDLES